ncbi:GMC oxidoreductase-domain-containing protein [Amylostereum chailletii]|nr:GMC oxidoreductase-domain-containing protein [Amylostereum chailletii]
MPAIRIHLRAHLTRMRRHQTMSIPGRKRQLDECPAIRSWMADPEEAYIELLGLPCHFFTPASVAVPGRRYYSFVVLVIHSLSRGSVHIPSSNPADAPAIGPNYLDHPVDLEMLTSGVKLALKLFNTDPVKHATVAHVMPSQGICDQGDSALKAYVKETVGCSFHPLGTASMLPRDEGGVVDENLKVYGTSNLRVIDCSILPNASKHFLLSLRDSLLTQTRRRCLRTRRALCTQSRRRAPTS